MQKMKWIWGISYHQWEHIDWDVMNLYSCKQSLFSRKYNLDDKIFCLFISIEPQNAFWEESKNLVMYHLIELSKIN